jgi:hypothetical protein
MTIWDDEKAVDSGAPEYHGHEPARSEADDAGLEGSVRPRVAAARCSTSAAWGIRVLSLACSPGISSWIEAPASG